MWVALGKERTRNLIWILDDHMSIISPHLIKWYYGHPNLWSFTYDGHINENLCGDLSTYGGGMFPWHNFNCCKFIMPWPRYRVNSSRLLNRFKCISQVIRVLDAHIKGEPILCLVSFGTNLFFYWICVLSWWEWVSHEYATLTQSKLVKLSLIFIWIAILSLM